MNRYIIDPMYGIVEFDESIMEVISSTELQRLREVRLCNVNSLFLIGSSNSNRFEHSLGTCYLASKFIEKYSNEISFIEQEKILVAALLHDVMNPALGHSLEYVLSNSLDEYDPVKGFIKFVDTDLNDNPYYSREDKYRGYYYNNRPDLKKIFESREYIYDVGRYLSDIGKYINGDGEFGKLISGSIDLDNIDNVCRMAYHMGIPFNHSLPLKLVDAFKYENGHIHIDRDNGYIKEWQKLREKLYMILLFNPDEFSAKSMLIESFELIDHNPDETKIHWYMVDSEIFESLQEYGILKRDYFIDIASLLIDDSVSVEELIDIIEYSIGLSFTDNVIDHIKENYFKSNDFSFKINNVEYIISNRGEKRGATLRRKVEFEHNLFEVIRRLMIGDLYKCACIFTSTNVSLFSEWIFDYKERRMHEYNITRLIINVLGINMRADNISIHGILDKNKINRRVYEDDLSSYKMLVGVFIRNHEKLKPSDFDAISKLIIDYFSKYYVCDETVQEHELYSEKIVIGND